MKRLDTDLKATMQCSHTTSHFLPWLATDNSLHYLLPYKRTMFSNLGHTKSSKPDISLTKSDTISILASLRLLRATHALVLILFIFRISPMCMMLDGIAYTAHTFNNLNHRDTLHFCSIVCFSYSFCDNPSCFIRTYFSCANK